MQKVENYILEGTVYGREWMNTTDGSFSVSSLFSSMTDDPWSFDFSFCFSMWETKASSRIPHFSGLLLKKSFLPGATFENVR